MKAKIESEAAEGGGVVIVLTIAEVLGSLEVADDITAGDKAALLDSIRSVACAAVEGDCTAVWKEEETTRRRSLLNLIISEERSLASASLGYAVRVVLDEDTPVMPTASYL